MAAPDPLEAVKEYLATVTAVTDLVSTRIVAGELPSRIARTWNTEPQKAIVIRAAGGGVFPSSEGWAELGDQRVDLDCYGETPHEAFRVGLATNLAMRSMTRNVRSGCVLFWALPSGGLTPLRDPDTEWPYALGTWQVFYSEKEVS